MNNSPKHSHYYDKAKDFYLFSKKHKDWPTKIKTRSVHSINDYYSIANDWLSNNVTATFDIFCRRMLLFCFIKG